MSVGMQVKYTVLDEVDCVVERMDFVKRHDAGGGSNVGADVVVEVLEELPSSRQERAEELKAKSMRELALLLECCQVDLISPRPQLPKALLCDILEETRKRLESIELHRSDGGPLPKQPSTAISQK